MPRFALIALFATPIFAFAQDATGCKDPQVLTRMPGCTIDSCEAKEFDGPEIPVSKDQDGGQVKKSIEGATEHVEYTCPEKLSSLQIFRNAQNAFRAAGYKEIYTDVYSGARYWLTVRKGGQWAHVYVDAPNYHVTGILTKEMEQAVQANADSWIGEIERTGRVSVYGINFDTAKATLRADSTPVLEEIASLMKKQPDWHFVVAGHTDSTGAAATNLPLSKQRAEAVITWLAAKGIDRARLTALGFGSQKPLAENDTDEGKAKNRRVDLIRLY